MCSSWQTAVRAQGGTSTLVAIQALVPPDGLADVMTFPWVSTTVHKDAVGQEMPGFAARLPPEDDGSDQLD